MSNMGKGRGPVRRALEAIGLAAMLSGSPNAEAAKKPQPTTTAADRIPMSGKNTASDQKKDWEVGLHHTWRGEKDDFKVDLWRIIAPAQLEIFKKYQEKGTIEFDIPYEYARLFNSDPDARNPLRPEDQKKVSRVYS